MIHKVLIKVFILYQHDSYKIASDLQVFVSFKNLLKENNQLSKKTSKQHNEELRFLSCIVKSIEINSATEELRFLSCIAKNNE